LPPPRVIHFGDPNYAAILQAAQDWGEDVVFYDNVYWQPVMNNTSLSFYEIPKENDVDKSSISHKPFKRRWLKHYGPDEVRTE
jgi:hypothetical protein